MSAALQLSTLWGASSAQALWREGNRKPVQPETNSAGNLPERRVAEPLVSLAFYRKHTESMLRRYLYASMQVGRSPSILSDPVSRGWASSRPIRTFEDAIIFVLDVEKCINLLGSLDRQILARVVIQEYTQVEAATLLGMSPRAMSYKFPQALDNLTEKLLHAGLLVLPH
jgi:hypothetical protein